MAISDGPIRLSAAVGGGAGLAIIMLVMHLADIRGFWPGMIGVIVGVIVGIVLGRFIGSIVFRRGGDGPGD